MKKTLQLGLLSALVLSITACGGGSHSNPIATVSSTATLSSNMASSSSATSSSVAAVATTLYTVSVDVPTSFATQTAATTLPQKLGQFFIASAQADEVASLTAANFAVVIVDLAGKVLDRVALADSDINKNEDGSWSLEVPGDPRLDCVIVADVTKPIVLAIDGNINQDGFVFAPTTATSVDIDVGSTAAYKNFIEELGGEGTFASLNINPADTQQIKAVENLVNSIQIVVADQALTGYSNVADALAAIKSTVSDTIKQEVVNVKNPATGNAVTLIRDEGGLFWFEGNDYNEIAYGGIAGTEEETGFYYNGTAFVKDTEGESEPQLVLSSTGWVVASDKIKVASFNADGTVTLQDTAADGAQETAEVTQVFDLAGRNISQYLAANYTTSLLGKMANPATVFAAGAKGYRVKITNPDNIYKINYQPGNEDGTCPWNAAQSATASGGNCNVVMMHNAMQGGASAPSGLSSLFSADVAPDVSGFVAINLPSMAGGSMLLVQLLDNAAKTERFYLQSWASGSKTLIGTGSWSELDLPILKEDARVIHIQIPKEVLAAAAIGVSNSSASKAASSEGTKTGSSESAKAISSEGINTSSQGSKVASSEGVKAGSEEGAGDKGSNSESPDYYIVQQAGFLRQLYVDTAGLHSEDAGAVFNGTAKADILTALDYTPPPTLLPSATIVVDGSAADWTDVAPAIVDPSGDQNGNSSTDLTQVAIAKSGDALALLLKVSGDLMFPYAPSRDYSHYEVALHFFSNSFCRGERSGYMVVNNFTSATKENFHMVNYYLGTQLDDLATVVAYSANILETSFAFSGLPADKGDYLALTASTHSFIGQEPMKHDDNSSQKACYKFR